MVFSLKNFCCCFGTFLLTFALPSCSSETEKIDNEVAPGRTVLIYLAGDNSLSDEVWEKVDALASGWHNTADNLLIYQDARGERGTPSLMRVVSEAGAAHTEVIKEYPDANSADPQLFSEVLRDALGGYPAPSYGLMLFSHGTGWLPAESYSNPRHYNPAKAGLRSIMDDAGREMEIADFAAAIPDGQFDFIVLEACLMAGVEVAAELRGKTDYLVASSAEILSPGFTAVYEQMLDCLFQKAPDLSGFAARYMAYCNNREGAYRSGTISVIDLKRMDELIRFVSPLLQREAETDISALQCFDRTENKVFFDFGDCMEQVIRQNNQAEEAADRIKQLNELLKQVILYKASTPYFVNLPIRRHSGLTIYVGQEAYPGLNDAYKELSWYRLTRGK